MDELSQVVRSPSLLIAGLVLVGASILVWLTVAVRAFWRLPVLPYEARRRVPWRGLEVMAVLLVFYSPLLIGLLLGPGRGPETADPTARSTAEETDVYHELQDLLEGDPSVGTWLLAGLVAVVAAPIVEEFFFRLLLQGWLEAKERSARRRITQLRSFIPGLGPVVLVSFLFAMSHFRRASPRMELDELKQSMIILVAWSVLTFGFALWVLRMRCGATAADLGFDRKRFFADVRLGVLACAAVCAPIIFLQFVTTLFVVPKDVAADPIPLFFLALMLGALYYRTHRIVPAIVLHMAFNATSLALLWLQLRAGVAGASAAGL